MRFDIRFDPVAPRIQETTEIASTSRIRFPRQDEERSPPRKRSFQIRRRSKRELAALMLSVYHFRRQSVPRSLMEMKLVREAVHAVLHFRSLWAECLSEDVSRNLDWLEQLSDSWVHLRDLEFTAASVGCTWIANPLEALRGLFDGADDDAGFSFHYYLNLAAGSDWFPVPFLNKLAQVHFEAIQRPHQNRIIGWMGLMSDMIRVWRFQSLTSRQCDRGASKASIAVGSAVAAQSSLGAGSVD
jgi:hypothetical protein